MLTILVVDDEYLVRMGIRNTIDWDKYGIEIIGEAGDGEEGLEFAIKYNPDIIITDIRMPFMNGLEFMEKLREHRIDSKVIVLSGYNEFEYVRAAVQNNASDYLLKPIENQQLIDVVLKVSREIDEDKKRRKYYEKLENELPYVEKQFIYDIISGSLQDETTIKEKMDFLGLSIAPDNNYIIVIKADDIDTLSRDRKNEELENVRHAIVSQIGRTFLFSSTFTGMFLEYRLYEWVLILHPCEECSQDHVLMLKNKSKEFQSETEKFWPGTVSIGISILCKDMMGIKDRYLEAVAASEQKPFPGQSSICYFGDDGNGWRPEVKRALEYLRKHFCEDISVETAAKELYLSPSHLMHIFKSETGKTFNESLIEFRIEAAKYLLKESPHYKIYQISDKVGYKDTKYFSQLFKKVTGISPSDYIRKEV